MDIFDKLNDKQREAVMATEGYVRVIAGAGSGKTKLLVSRYAYLVTEYGIDPANILCVTFTNKAAGEMKRRIRALIGPEYDTTLICTFHGFCARLLRENPEKIFFSKGFQIIDQSQQKQIMEEIYQKHELKLDHASFEMMLKKLGAFKFTPEYVPRFISSDTVPIMRDILNFDDVLMEEFLQRQKAIYALDFDDLMNFAIYLLENDAEIREKWQTRLNYIQVDEFQDSSRCEMQLINLLSDRYKNLMIVGDPDQNIYEWRGSEIALLVDFDKTHVPTTTILLTQNYRSTPQILKCANNLIEKNELRIKKDLFTNAKPGADVIHYHSKSDELETDKMVETIKKLTKKEGFSYSDCAVLYRSGFLSRIIEKKLTESNVPYEIFGGVRFFQRMEIVDLVSYLRLVEYGDDISFRRVVNRPARRFGRARMAFLEESRENYSASCEGSSEITLYEMLKLCMDSKVIRSSGVLPFINAIDSIRKDVPDLRISEIVNRVCVDTGYEKYIRELGDEERLENLAEFKRIASEFESGFGENISLRTFLQQVALQSGEDRDQPRDAVKLMTIHASKGLEFPVVFIVGLSESIFPSSKTIEERKKLGLEEERRLCYVAITRAMKRLFLMDSEGFTEKGSKKLPSRFLEEIGTDNYVRVGKIPQELLLAAKGQTMRSDKAAAGDFAFKIGDEVNHHVFGRGVVEALDTKRGSYIIKFDRLPMTRNISGAYFQSEHRLPEDAGNSESPANAGNDVSTASPVDPAEGGRDASCEIDPAGLHSGAPDHSEKKPAAIYDYLLEDEDGLPDAGKPGGTPFLTPPFSPPLSPPSNSSLGQLRGMPDFTPTVAVPPVQGQPSAKASKASQIAAPGPEANQGRVVSPELQKQLEESDNLWKRDDVPHTGWVCTGISDLGEPAAVCQMCGYQIIRYVHHMQHPDFRPLNVGCHCAGKMEGDPEAAQKREQDFKNRQQRLDNFMNRKWKQSRNGNDYLKIKDHLIVLYKVSGLEKYKYSLDGVFCAGYFNAREDAVRAAFEALEKIPGS
ncbi:MAG: UvrD-helicase domain-containing protein [Clostridia bacterium]|nr:UvrD-helicase domain-containing protein [Clostridia bacterium]